MVRNLIVWVAGFVLAELVAAAPARAGEGKEVFRYLRPAGKAFALEASITVHTRKDGWSIESVTGTAAKAMTIHAHHLAAGRLREARAVLAGEGGKKEARVEVKGDVAHVQGEEGKVQEFPVGDRTIVTSAPDWSDIFLLCRRFKPGSVKEEFQGLWIHPTQKAQAIRFTIEKEGTDTVERDGKRITLNRYRIQIRGPAPYRAWANEAGILIKLVPASGKGGLIREGWEGVWEELKGP